MSASWAVKITPADNGVVVRVGCKLFVFEDTKVALNLLKRYLNGEEEQIRKELCPDEDYCNQTIQPAPPPCDTAEGESF